MYRASSNKLWTKLSFAPIFRIQDHFWKWRVFCTFPPMREAERGRYLVIYFPWPQEWRDFHWKTRTASMPGKMIIETFWPRLTHETKKDRKMQLFLWGSENLNETFDIWKLFHNVWKWPKNLLFIQKFNFDQN